jgi:hypothetical protein
LYEGSISIKSRGLVTSWPAVTGLYSRVLQENVEALRLYTPHSLRRNSFPPDIFQLLQYICIVSVHPGSYASFVVIRVMTSYSTLHDPSQREAVSMNDKTNI